MSTKKSEIDELYKKITEKDEDYLKKYRFTLWVNFLGPRTSYREFRLHQVDDMEVFAIFGFKLLINGDQLIRSMKAFEITRNLFVFKESANEEDWKKLVEMIINGKKPRIIFDSAFRRSLGLSDNLADLDIFVLSITKYE